MTETTWQRTSKYESSVQSPPQTTIWQLATHLKLQNAPQITLPAALPTRSWNEDLGKKRWERGNPQKTERRLENNRKPENCEQILILDEPWFLKPKHTKIWSRNKREHLQNKIAIRKINGTSWLVKDRIHSNATRENKEKWDHSGWAACNCSPKVQTTSCRLNLKSTTIETCILGKLKFSSRNVADNILCM